jgi:hypothetical protein
MLQLVDPKEGGAEGEERVEEEDEAEEDFIEELWGRVSVLHGFPRFHAICNR